MPDHTRIILLAVIARPTQELTTCAPLSLGPEGGMNRVLAFAATGGFVLSVLSAGVPLFHYVKARRVPAIHDITTDTAHPPVFVALAAVRTAAPNGLAYAGAAVAAAQQQAYPDIGPSLSPLPPATLLAQAEGVARALGWEIVALDPPHGRLEATDTSLLFGFTDDIVLRIVPHEPGSQLDIRSMSRVGRSDVGVNAQRIRRFLTQLSATIARNEG